MSQIGQQVLVRSSGRGNSAPPTALAAATAHPPAAKSYEAPIATETILSCRDFL